MRAHGMFHRLESTTQTSAIAIVQVATGEVWGKTPRNGMEPTVEAYAGVIDGRRGIEFSTDIEPHPCGSPFRAYWYLTRTAGVDERFDGAGEQHASIPAEIDNRQP